MLRSKYHELFNSEELHQLAPGYYIDILGGGYFYLTGMYSSIRWALLEKPRRNTPEVLIDVLEELRRSLEDDCCIELMD